MSDNRVHHRTSMLQHSFAMMVPTVPQWVVSRVNPRIVGMVLCFVFLLVTVLTTGAEAKEADFKWVKHGGTAKALVVDTSGDAWKLDKSGSVWHLSVADAGKSSASWIEQLGKHFISIRATLDGRIWGITKESNLYRLTLNKKTKVTTWKSVYKGVWDVASAANGDTWLLLAGGKLVKKTAAGTSDVKPQPPGDKGTQTYLLSSKDGELWVRFLDNSLMRLDQGKWKSIPSSLSGLGGLTIGKDGTVLGIDGNGKLLKRNASTGLWEQGHIPYPAQQVAVSTGGKAWMLGTNGTIYSSVGKFKAQREYVQQQADIKSKIDGNTALTRQLKWKNMTLIVHYQGVGVKKDGTKFSKQVTVPRPHYQQISINGNAVYGLSDGGVYKYTGFYHQSYKNPNKPQDGFNSVTKETDNHKLWQKDSHFTSERMSHIAASEHGVWALDGTGQLYFFFIYVKGSGKLVWSTHIVKGGHAKLIAVGPDDHLWGWLKDNTLSQWGVSSAQWSSPISLSFSIRDFAIGPNNDPWVVDTQGVVRWLKDGIWKKIPSTKFTHSKGEDGSTIYSANNRIDIHSIGVGSNGTIYITDDKDAIYWLDNQLVWRPATGKMHQIRVDSKGNPWAVTAAGNVMAVKAVLTAERDALKKIRNTQPVDLIPPSLLTQTDVDFHRTTDKKLQDIAIGSEGSIYGIGTNGNLLCFSNADKKFIVASRGQNSRIGVSSDGAPWVINTAGMVSRFDTTNKIWHTIPNFTGVDISGGSDGSIWAAGADGNSYRYDKATGAFQIQNFLQGGVKFQDQRIAGGTADSFWVVTKLEGQLMQCESGGCKLALQGAYDVAVAPDNKVFALDFASLMRRYDPGSKEFPDPKNMSNYSHRISVGPKDIPWLIDFSGYALYGALIKPKSKQINTAQCAVPFAQAPTPAPVATDNLQAVADLDKVKEGDSLNLLANDTINGNPVQLSDVKLSIIPGSNPGGMVIKGDSVQVPMGAFGWNIYPKLTNMYNKAQIPFRYQICPQSGLGMCSTAQVTITVKKYTPPPPGKPTGVTAVSDFQDAKVSFSTPTSDGGSSITSYKVIANDGHIAIGKTSPVVITGLTNGVPYTFTVQATSKGGVGAASAPSDPVVPNDYHRPTWVTAASAGYNQASVSFEQLENPTGNPIASYEVTSSPAYISATGTSSPIEVTGLPSGVYTFGVQVHYAIGKVRDDTPSVRSNGVVISNPPTEPDTPTEVSAIEGNGQATVNFKRPFSNGGRTISFYIVTAMPGNIETKVRNSHGIKRDAEGNYRLTGSYVSIVVPGLTNGVSYTFTAKAVNAIGVGSVSSPSNAVVPVSHLPGVPTHVSAVGGDKNATVNFSAPVSDGGRSITSYTVTSHPTAIKATGTTAPIVVNGLTNGVQYTFTVRADNEAGTSADSVNSNTVLSATHPSVPRGVRALDGTTQVTFIITPPGSNGGSPITRYIIKSSPDNNKITITHDNGKYQIHGLDCGVSYTFIAKAVNDIGEGPASPVSDSAKSVCAPDSAPENVLAVAGNALATISFTAPASDGGTSINAYTVTSSDGKVVTATQSPIVVKELANGISHTFTVAARNVIGTGPDSASSKPVIYVIAPNAPSGVNATAGDGIATVSFTPPTQDGGKPITSYIVTSNPQSIISTGTSSPVVVTGLANGQQYTFTVKAVNAVGTGSASAISSAVTPVGLPGAPTAVKAVAGDGKSTVSFVAPSSNGGKPITGYTVTSSSGGITATGLSSPIIVTGLTNDQAYTFSVTASNVIGQGTIGKSISVTPVAPASAPTNVTAVVVGDTISVSFTPPVHNGGRPIANYSVIPISIIPLGAIPFSVISAYGRQEFTAHFTYHSPIVVKWMPKGVNVRFIVYAKDRAGQKGPSSAPSNTVIISSVPWPPTGKVTAYPTDPDDQIKVSFTPPASNGGSPITGYIVTSSNGNTTTGTASPIWLNPSDYYDKDVTFTVKAMNAKGNSAASAASNSLFLRTPSTTTPNVVPQEVPQEEVPPEE